MSGFIGGSQSKSQSGDKYGQQVFNSLNPTMNAAGQASGQMANLLGLNGPQGQNQAFQNWQNSTGYQFGLNQGMQSINGNAAAQGLLNSGATAKALDTYGQNYANTQIGNYQNQLQQLLSGGLQSAGLINQAGQFGKSNALSFQTGGGFGSSGGGGH